MHELHTPQLPLSSFVHKNGGETDIAVDQATVHVQKAYGFLGNGGVCEESNIKRVHMD